MKSFKCVGLALKGGCREGAFQVGVVTALAERNIEIDVLTGEGIGGLNAGIIAASENTKQAAARLTKVWEELARSVETEVDIPTFLRYCLSAGNQLRYSSTGLRILRRIAKRSDVNLGIDPKTGQLEDTALTELLAEYLSEEGLANGKPLYALTFKVENYFYGLGISLLAATKRFNTSPSTPVFIQGVNRNAMKSFLLSSTAIPLLFKTFRYNGIYHFDGRIGGVKMGIQNPVYTTLIRHNCDLIIAPFCEHELNREDTGFITVNPTKPLARSFGLTGPLKDHFGLTPNMIEGWMEQGYYDTLAKLDIEEKKGVLFAPSQTDPKLQLEDKPYLKVNQEIQEALDNPEPTDKRNQ